MPVTTPACQQVLYQNQKPKEKKTNKNKPEAEKFLKEKKSVAFMDHAGRPISA